jgi:hypothetical protein
MKKSLFALAVVGLASLTASSAHAGLCVDPSWKGLWVISGNAPYYPNTQESYQLNDLKLDSRCVDDSTETCNGNVCTITDGVKLIPTVSVGVTTANLIGPPTTTSYLSVKDAQSGSDGWFYADNTDVGNPTRVWFRPQGANLQVVFDVTYNGKHYINWETFVRPILHFPVVPIQLAN